MHLFTKNCQVCFKNIKYVILNINNIRNLYFTFKHVYLKKNNLSKLLKRN